MQEKFRVQQIFNPGLVLTGLQTTLPLLQQFNLT